MRRIAVCRRPPASARKLPRVVDGALRPLRGGSGQASKRLSSKGRGHERTRSGRGLSRSSEVHERDEQRLAGVPAEIVVKQRRQLVRLCAHV